MRYVLLSVLILSGGVGAADFSYQDHVELTDLDSETNNGKLGWAVAINDDFVFMGAPEKVQVGGRFEGRTFLFQIGNARQLDFLAEIEGQDEDPFRFGAGIATDRDWAAIGYVSDNLIEMFRREGNSWVLHKLIEPPEIPDVTVRGMGEHIDLEGDTLVVGTPKSHVGGVSNGGAVLVFSRNTGGVDNWGLETHLVEDAPISSQNFAKAIAIGASSLVVGDDSEERALLYRRSAGSWQFDKALQPLNAENSDGFGVSVAAEGDVVVVGALAGNDDLSAPSNAGSVHVFERNQGGSDNFGEVVELVPSEPESSDNFGWSLRLRQGILAVGAPRANQAYVFANPGEGWQEIDMVEPPPELTFNNANFGSDVDYLDGSLVVGADRWDDTSSSDRYGAVFLFEDPAIVRCGVLDGIFCDRFEN